MHELLKIYWLIQNYINTNYFLGIPLDILAHFIISVILTNSLLQFKAKMHWILPIIFIIAILKEIIDWKAQTHPGVLESIKDIVVTMIYPTVLFFIRKKLKAA